MSNSDMIKPVGRKTLTQEIVDQFTELVMKGAWRPGEIIPSEKELASRFGVGRSTIREALQSLVVVGVLESNAGGRSVVQEPNSQLLSGAFRWGLLLGEQNLEDLTEVRLHVEVECAGLAAVRRESEDAVELLNIHKKMVSYEADEIYYIDYDNQFHRKIAESAKNAIYVNLVATIQSLVRLWYPATYKNEDTIGSTREEHKWIVEAIQSGNEEEAKKAMRHHILMASKRLTEVLANGKSNRSI
ncbi:FadR family transcriptional regulator [bacterium LRH843]|nr:FadR family transcriptional regulator [bacterium LRH843]